MAGTSAVPVCIEFELLNFVETLMNAAPAEICLPSGSKLIPAGL